MHRYHPYNNNEPKISSNILEANAATFEATQPSYNNLLNDQQNVKFINQANEILKYQNELFVENSFEGHQLIKEIPNQITGINGAYNMKFSIKIIEFTKANNIRLIFKIPVKYTFPINNYQNDPTIAQSRVDDTYNLCNLEQRQFTFLQIIDRVDCTIGNDSTSMFLNDDQRTNLRLLTLKNTMKEKQSLYSLSTGINCTKTTRSRYWESANYDLYNQIYNINSTYIAQNSTLEPSKFFYTVCLPLGDILPFFEQDITLPRGFIFNFEIRFKCDPNSIFMGENNLNSMVNYSKLELDSTAEKWPIDPSTCFILYDSYSLKENLIEKFNKLPYILTNNSYVVEKQFDADISGNSLVLLGNGRYRIIIPKCIPPEKIVLYFSIQKGSNIYIKPNNDNDNNFDKQILHFTPYTFLGGFQVKNIVVYVSGVRRFFTIDDKSILSNTKINNEEFKYWDNSMTIDEISLNLCKKEPDDIKTRLKLIDNIIPIQIPINKSNTIQKNVIEQLSSVNNLVIEFEIEGDYKSSNDPDEKNFTNYKNVLPKSSLIHLVLEYNYQLLYDRVNQQISNVSWPFTILNNKVTLNESL